MEIAKILGMRGCRRLARTLTATVFMLVATVTTAAPVIIDWDALTWLPAGNTNLSETYNIAGFDVIVSYGGNVAFLDQTTTPPSPGITDPADPALQNTGGLVPVEASLVVGTDYPDMINPVDAQVSVTVDLSAYPNGVSDLSFSIFDVDQAQGFVDEVTVTALAGGVSVDPTTIVTSPANSQINANTVTSIAGSPPTSPDGNVSFTFAQSDITELTIVYRNVATNPNPGFQWINIHDITFNFVQADLSLTKTVDDPTPPTGGSVVYTITLTNDGPDTGTGLEVTDQLPAGLTYVSDDSGGAYDNASGVWTVGTLASGASATLQITATVNAVGPYDNVAELTAANEFDPDSTPNNNDPSEDDQDSVPITPTIFADLSLTKVVNDTEPVAGSNITFDIVISNAGPVTATGVTVDDLLPSGFAYVSDSSTQGPYDPVTGVWDVGTLAVGTSATLQITAQVLFTGNYLNTAEVATSDQPDPDSTPGNGDPTEDDQASSQVTPVAIGVAKSVSFGPVNNGDGTFTLIYSINVQNFGGTDLENLQVSDDLDATFAGLPFVVDSVNSTTLAVNPNYDGSGDQNLLAGTDTLAAGASGFIALAVTVTPGANFGPFDNTAIGSGTSPGGTPVTDLSQLGVNPDPDGDGDPGNNNVPTPVTFGEAPQIGLAKRVSTAAVNNGDGTFSFDYTMFVENTGDVVLSGLQIVDNLAQSFAAAQAFQVDAISSAEFTVNAAFDGSGDINMLAGGDALAIGASGEVSVSVTVTPGVNLGPYENSAIANGTSPAGTPVSDTSTDGVDPDPDGDDDPGNNSVPTPIAFAENPVIGVAKRVSAGPVNNGDGTFTASYEILVENFGDVTLASVQVTDDLSATFAAAVSYTLDAFSSVDFAVNPNYDGATDTNLLAGTDTLAIGASGRISISVTIEPGSNLGPYLNTAVGSGVSPAGLTVQDDSTDGVDPDPDNDGTPTNNNTPTPLTLVENPGIGAAKAVTTPPLDNQNGTFTFRYTVLIENNGDVNLSNVQITDDLTATFAQASGFAVNAVQSNDLAVNPAYDGATDTNLLQGTDTLAIGAQAQLEVTLTVTPGAFAGPYLNTAVAEGTSPAGIPVQDDSTDGLDPDPDNDGTPGNNDTPTPVTFATPLIVVTKTASPRQVSIGDLVRYTITADNQGGASFQDLVLSDQIPAGFSYVDGSARLSGGGGPLTVTGERPVLFGGIDLASGELATVTYILRVGAGVVPGLAPNTVTPVRNGVPVGSPATETVEIVADPDLQETTIVGKVFLDIDEDGYQDEDAGEVGIPGVRLATVEGLLVETDAQGRYHIEAIDGGFMERGRNFIVKVDPATLPDGAEFTTENPRVKRITQGLMNRFDFGVKLPGGAADRLYPINVKIAEVFFEENSARIRPEFDSAFAELGQRLRDHCGGKLFIEGHGDPNCGADDPDRLATKIESETFIFVPHFGIRKAALTREDRAQLEGLIERWRDAQDLSLVAIGHTSSVRIAPQNRHEFADNFALGLARSTTVANYLMGVLGIAPDAATIESRGLTEPVGDNSTREGRAANRRVELTLQGRRVRQTTLPAERFDCDPELAERRARVVYEKIAEYMGQDVICDVEVLVGEPPAD